jgi:hypothetical protein
MNISVAIDQKSGVQTLRQADVASMRPNAAA